MEVSFIMSSADFCINALKASFSSQIIGSASVLNPSLEFSGNKAINLSVENIEVFLTDIGDPWLTAKKPNHDNE